MQIFNPFICSNQQCECFITHRNCTFKRVKQFINIVHNKKNKFKQTENTINQEVDSLIDKISELRENLILKLKKKQQTEITFAKKSFKDGDYLIGRLTGSMVSKMLDEICDDQKQKELKMKIQSVEKGVVQMTKAFDKFFDRMEKVLQIDKNIMQKQQQPKQHQQSTKIAFWNHLLKGPNIIINDSLLKRNSSFNNRVALLQLSINQMCDSLISWKMRILNKQKKSVWTAIGIGLRQVLKKNGFDFINYQKYQADHGCYVITNHGTSFTHQNYQYNNVLFKQMAFIAGEIVKIDVDLQHSTIKYTNESSNCEIIQNITFLYKNSVDQFHICACLEGYDDQIEILSPISSDRGQWIIQSAEKHSPI